MSYAPHFELADRLGMHLHDLLGWVGPMTHRQFSAWQRWLRDRWEVPSRSDYYLMQIAFEARNILRSLAGSGRSLSLEDFKLKFGTAPAVRQQSPEELKAMILGGLGIAPPGISSQEPTPEG